MSAAQLRLDPSIDRFQSHITISGFLQHQGKWNGIFKLKHLLLNEIGCSIDRQIHYYKWYANWKDVAQAHWIIKERYDIPVEVYIYASSYGGGWGAAQLCKYLDRSNIPVKHVVLSDAIFRHPLFFMRWLALVKGQTIKFPNNVEKIDWFYQTQSLPSGHTPVSKVANVVNKGIELPYDHVFMDDASEFHDKCLEVARSAL